MSSIKILAIAASVALLGSACFDESGATDETESGTTAESISVDADGTQPEDPSADAVDDGHPTDAEPDDQEPDSDRPCDGGAFPQDDEFRELLCAVQWAQLDVASAGGEIDDSWTGRASAAIILYGDDRAGAFAELEAILAEMSTAIGDVPATSADTDVPPDDHDLRDCMVRVAQLIVEASGSGGFDPTRVAEWQERAENVEPLVEAGDFATAESVVCDLRDDIAAAIDDPSLVPD